MYYLVLILTDVLFSVGYKHLNKTYWELLSHVIRVEMEKTALEDEEEKQEDK
jgi:hypothetical protein